jgi:hypothetical protein
MLATNLFFPPDLDDSWQIDNRSMERQKGASGELDLGGGYKMRWENPGGLMENREVSLRFNLIAPDNRPALLQPYMGMSGHAVVRRQDGAVFAHIHPLGTFSMAAREFFLTNNLSNASSFASNPAGGSHNDHTNAIGSAETIAFPYAFPMAGAYRIWVQAKSQQRIMTGAFDATVAPK